MTEKKSQKKSRTGPTTWQKGQSGNPGGRSPRVGPNGESIAELARGHTLEMLNVLVEVANDKTHAQRVQAANAVLDRGWGKPKESVDLDARVEGSGVPQIVIIRASDADGSAD